MNASRTPQQASLPPSSSASNKSSGCLSIRVLSANDLPLSQVEPIAVSVTVAGSTVRTGPPSARHKNKNCFRFDSLQELTVNAPLATLYKSKAILTVEYQNPNDNLTTLIECKKLCIQETTSLSLDLKHSIPPEDTTIIRATHSTCSDDNEIMTPPSVSLQVTLNGPLRTEICAMLNLAKAWFTIMDTIQDSLAPILQTLPSAKYLLIPSVPVLATFVVASPIVLGISILFFPLVLPLFIIMSIIVLGWMSVGVFLLASSRIGRDFILHKSTPLLVWLKTQAAVQIMLYDTGTRPTPATLLQPYLPTDIFGKLFLSILMDAVGSSSYLLPGIGESFDMIWCPCQTLLIQACYGQVTPNLMYISFLEEFLPFTDILPSATIGWASEFGPSLVEHAKREFLVTTSDKNTGGRHVGVMTT